MKGSSLAKTLTLAWVMALDGASTPARVTSGARFTSLPLFVAADEWGTTSASTVDTVDVSRTEEDMAQEDSPLGGEFDVLLTVNSPARGTTYFAFQGPWRRRGVCGLGLWGGPVE